MPAYVLEAKSYSITSVAKTRSVRGTARPIAFAALRLSTISNLIGN